MQLSTQIEPKNID